MTLTAQRHSSMHPHKKRAPQSHHICRCLHVYEVRPREGGRRESGNEQRAPKAGREREMEKDTTSEEGPLSSSTLQATDTESHNSAEQVNTPQAFFFMLHCSLQGALVPVITSTLVTPHAFTVL